MLKSISKRNVIATSLIGIIVGLISYAYFLKVILTTNNKFVSMFVIISMFLIIIAGATLKASFIIKKDRYKSKDNIYEFVITTIIMMINIIIAAIFFTFI